MPLLELQYRRHIHANIVPDGRMGAAAGFNTDDPVGRQHILTQQELRVFARIDVIGDDRNGIRMFQPLTKPQDTHGFA